MSELAFPFAGIALLFMVVIPALTVLSKVGLSCLRRRSALSERGDAAFVLLVAPSVVPIAWFFSAALHQAEPGKALAACVHDHLEPASCSDAIVLAATLGVAVLWAVSSRMRRSRSTAVAKRGDAGIAARLATICARHPELAVEASRILVLEAAHHAFCTRGILRRRIEVDSGAIAVLDDAAIEGALLHELEHLRAWDPLRFLVATASLALNPMASFLRDELREFRMSREIACDRSAVSHGADPLALAEAIVAAASTTKRTGFVACLGESRIESVRVRVQLLLEYVAARPKLTRRTATGVVAALACVALLLGLPHAWDAPLEAFHHHVERAASLIEI